MKLFFKYLKYRRRELLVYLSLAGLLALSFYIFRLPLKAVAYPVCICAVLGAVLLLVDFLKTRERHMELDKIKSFAAALTDCLPEQSSIEDEDYQEIIRLLCLEKNSDMEKAALSYNNMTDYFMAWAHQIKIPIASMLLTLQNEDTPASRKIRAELGRIEAYVSMVLTYIRLESESSDYVFKEYSLDEIIKPVIRKFAGEFIGRRLSLNYSDVQVRVLTDEKWLSFVIEQLISNGLKYTENGGIDIFMENNSTLCIKDTGVGIAPEDLPRIFEKGYTGNNGRTDRKSSGIGLNLCKRICANLGHGISAKSELGKGTIIRIDFNNQIR